MDSGLHMDELIPPVVRRHTKKGTMLNFHRIFLNPFEDKEISFTETLSYASVSLQRMIANNPGAALAARITATTAALTGLEGGVSDDLTKAALQKAKTDAKDTFREVLPANIAKIHGAVVAAFGVDSSPLIECFPQGRTIFSSCRDEQLNNHLQQLVNCITPMQAQVGLPAIAAAGALVTNWTTLYAAQGTAKGAKSQSAEMRDQARATLRLELFTNLLTLALMFPGDTDKCDLYCPQHLLRGPQSAAGPGAATLSAAAWDAGTGTVMLTMQADDADTFTVQRRLAGEPDFSEVAADVAADADGNATYEDTIAAGSYEYQVVPFRGATAGDASNIVPVLAA